MLMFYPLGKTLRKTSALVRLRVDFSLQQFSEKRNRKPFVLCHGKSNQGPKVALKRKDETVNATAVIHGGTKTQKIPALDGMFDTLNKRCKLSDLTNYISNKTFTRW